MSAIWALFASVGGGFSLAAAMPEHFVWGTSSAAWQFEGANADGGRGPSIWDDFCTGGDPAGAPHCWRWETADVAAGQYDLQRFAGDIDLMRLLGTSAYRLSLSWSRLFPDGGLRGAPPVFDPGSANPAGVEHYTRVLRMLNQAGVEPYVTLLHFDLPSALEREHGGWLDANLSVASFAGYADFCFRTFGPDLVRHWITLNEPHTTATSGYMYDGVAAPARCSNRNRCFAGNSSTEPYVVAHNMLRAHGRAASIYKKGGYRARNPRGSLTMVVSGDWTEPRRNGSQEDVDAAQRRQEFQIGWFLDPIFRGRYPDSMRHMIPQKLPEFTKAERAELYRSVDYLAINHYTSRYGQRPIECGSASASPDTTWDDDQCCQVFTESESGRAMGPTAGADWLLAVPWGFRKLLLWLDERYSDAGQRVPIMVTESGCDDIAEEWGDLEDDFRVTYLQSYVGEMAVAMSQGVDVRGYFVWALLDNFEWGDGYKRRFGLVNVDTGIYHPNLEGSLGGDGIAASLRRTPKRSFHWLRQYIADHRIARLSTVQLLT